MRNKLAFIGMAPNRPLFAADKRLRPWLYPQQPSTKRTSSPPNGSGGPSGNPNHDAFGLKAGSLKSIAASMYSRLHGATLAEVKAVVGSIQYNVLKELQAKGYVVERKPERTGDNGRVATRYFLRT